MNCSRLRFVLFVGIMGIRSWAARPLLAAARWLDPFCVGEDS